MDNRKTLEMLLSRMREMVEAKEEKSYTDQIFLDIFADMDRYLSAKKLEKVMLGNECCQISMNDNNPFEKCAECPYNSISVVVEDCRTVLCRETLEVLRGE